MKSGAVFPGRCKSTNLCAYCAKLAALENTELLTLDALHGTAPALYALLTTRTATVDMSRFYRALELVMRALKRPGRWPGAEYAALIEYTTGRAATSGGARRPHWNLLLKGIPVADADRAREIVRSVWCRHVDALPQHQDLQPVRSAGGLMRYIALHFQKQSQTPPAGFRGHRFRASKGYLWTGTAAAREAARASLARKRIVWTIEQATGGDLDAWEVDHIADGLVDEQANAEWKIVQTLPQTGRRPQLAKAVPGAAPDGHLVMDRKTRELVPK